MYVGLRPAAASILSTLARWGSSGMGRSLLVAKGSPRTVHDLDEACSATAARVAPASRLGYTRTVRARLRLPGGRRCLRAALRRYPMTDLSHLPPRSVEATEVPDNHGANLYRADPGFGPHLARLGAPAGAELDTLAGIADHNPPTLSVRARNGRDVDTIHKHPAYVAMERLAFGEFGLARMSHRGGVLGWADPLPAAAKYALTYLFVQAEFRLCCPVSMTDSLTRTLRKFGSPEIVERFMPMLTAEDFDAQAQGAMFMTEQGAGSDVSATATRASRDADGTWRLHGDKWFCSNPDADFAMVLARPD